LVKSNLDEDNEFSYLIKMRRKIIERFENSKLVDDQRILTKRFGSAFYMID